MTALNRVRAAEPDQDVLRVAAEPRHLVRNHLPDGDDEVIRAVDERTVDGEREGKAERTADDLVDLVRGELTECPHVVAPAVVQQPRRINRVAEHQPGLGRAERMVRPKRGHDVDAFDVTLEQTGELRDDLARA